MIKTGIQRLHIMQCKLGCTEDVLLYELSLISVPLLCEGKIVLMSFDCFRSD
jgi:hypothetical protein